MRRIIGKNNTPKTKKAPEPAANKRGPRANRAYTYRGYTFFIKTEGNTSKIFILNPQSGQMEHQIDVAADKAKEAIYEVAKMAIAEEALLKLTQSRSSLKNRSVSDDGEVLIEALEDN